MSSKRVTGNGIPRRAFLLAAGGGAAAFLLGDRRARADSRRPSGVLAPSPIGAPARAGAYRELKDGVKDAATLSGTVKWEGEIPEPYRFDLTLKMEDLPYSRRKPDETTKESTRLVIDKASRGVRYSIVTVEGIAEGKPWPAQKAEMTTDHCEYFPHAIWMQAGRNFVGRNEDPIPNSLHAYREKVGGDTVFNWLLPAKGDTKTEPIEDPGMVLLVCDSGHRWESAFIFVAADPYVAVTDAHGKFAIDGIPPGTYSVRFWHEGWQVTPKRSAEGKVEDYRYSKDLVKTAEIAFKAKETKEAEAKLGEAGWVG